MTQMSLEPVHAWLVDLDGTVALMQGRGPFDWHKVHTDLPNGPVIQVVRSLIFAGNNVIFISGRMEQCRNLTTEWLAEHIPISLGCPLIMRADDDTRPDEVFKLEQLASIRESGVIVDGVIDDRRKVVDMWRAQGLACLQVAPGEF